LLKSLIEYDFISVAYELTEAKAAIIALREIPFYREWTDKLQQVELRREIEGTTRIEGAAYTEKELDAAISDTTEQLLTRSQRQGRAMKITYDWIATIQSEVPINASLILDMHRKIITGADDDHCVPGQVRGNGENVTFGQPRRRGAEGGMECMSALVSLSNAIQVEYQNHDPLIQALATHYHLGAIHPFTDGNGRTARALETLMLKRAGLHDICFVAMSNYYYEERVNYLKTLGEVHTASGDLTLFLRFGLKGIAQQSRRLLNEIKPHLQKVLFRDLVNELFGRLQSPRKKLIADRQMFILKMLLKEDSMQAKDIYSELISKYSNLKAPIKAFLRDIFGLQALKVIRIEYENEVPVCEINLKWPMEMTEVGFRDIIKNLPKAKGSISLA